MTKIDFSFDTQFGTFADSLNIEDDVFATLTQDQIVAMQQQRLNNWLAIVNPAPTQE